MAYQSELKVITAAKKLASYVMTITQKSPKQFRFSLVAKMQTYVLDVVENLYRANEVFISSPDDIPNQVLRLRYQREAMTNLKLLCYMAQAVEKSHFGEYEDEFLAHILFCCLDERVMEWGIVDMQDIVDAFDKLDSEYPYESGFQPHQAFTTKVIDQEENAVVVKLITKYGETIGVTRIYD